MPLLDVGLLSERREHGTQKNTGTLRHLSWKNQTPRKLAVRRRIVLDFRLARPVNTFYPSQSAWICGGILCGIGQDLQ